MNHRQVPLPVPVIELRSPADSKRRQSRKFNALLFLIASAVMASSTAATWYQMSALSEFQLQQHNDKSLGEKVIANPPPRLKPMRFIAVVGLYHSGTTAMWNSIKSNERVAAEKGVNLKAYASDSGGYPPCGVSLLSDSTVNMSVTMGNLSGIAWQNSMKRKLYDFKYEPHLKLWRLVRRNPRRMPPLEMRFRSLFNAWEYYMRGYTSWEAVSVGKNCYADSNSRGSTNCLGGNNNVPNSKRNMVIVRYEDYLMKPNKVLADIFSFATFGLINSKTDADNFAPYEAKKLKTSQGMLKNLDKQDFFSRENTHYWEGAAHLEGLCAQLGYSCDESTGIFTKDSESNSSN